jgi:hypothetical protein
MQTKVAINSHFGLLARAARFFCGSPFLKLPTGQGQYMLIKTTEAKLLQNIIAALEAGLFSVNEAIDRMDASLSSDSKNTYQVNQSQGGERKCLNS